MDYRDIFQEVERRLFDSIDINTDIDDEAIMDRIQTEICEYAKGHPIDVEDRMKLQKALFYSLRKYDVLSRLLEDDDITEIMINGFDHIFIEKWGKVVETEEHFSSKEKLDDVIQQIVGANNQIINETTPIVDTRLEDGSRVNIVLPPIAIDGSAMSIRRFSKEPITLTRLIEFKSINDEIKSFLERLIAAKYNIFISF